MKKLIFLLSIPLLIIYLTLTTCKKKNPCPDGSLTTEELSWVHYYEDGHKTFVFKYDTLIDTIYSGLFVDDYDQCNGCDWQQQRQMYLIGNHKNDPDHTAIVLKVSHASSCKQGYVSMSNLYGTLIEFPFSDYSPQNNVVINSSTYNNVYILEKDSAIFTQDNCFRIYYTKENGILEFDKTNGQHWVKIN